MKYDQRITLLTKLFLSVLMGLMLVIISPTYVLAKDRILDGRNAIDWLIDNGYVEKKPVYIVTDEYNVNINYHYKKRHTTYRTTRRFERFAKLFYSNPPSPDGFKGWTGYNLTDNDTFPMHFSKIVITVDWQTYERYRKAQNPLPTPLPAPQPNLRQGPFTTYYSNGAVREKGYYKDGKLHGTKKWWYSNGNLKSKIDYENGEIVGKYITYYNNHNNSQSACWIYPKYGKRYKCP